MIGNEAPEQVMQPWTLPEEGHQVGLRHPKRSPLLLCRTTQALGQGLQLQQAGRWCDPNPPLLQMNLGHDGLHKGDEHPPVPLTELHLQ